MSSSFINLDLSVRATDEEKLYAEIIQKFWESWAICYAHESIIASHENNSDVATKMAVSVYKGVVSDFVEDIHEAREKLEKAETFEDMQNVYNVLENIWDGEK